MNTPVPFCVTGLVAAGLPLLLVLLTALVPDYVRRARATMQARPWLSFLLGLVNALFFSGLAMLSGSGVMVVKILGGVSLMVMLPLLVMAGLLVATAASGQRLWLHVTSQAPTDKLSTLLRSLIVGVVFMAVMLLIPLFGWLTFLLLLLTGLGAAIVALFQRKTLEAAAAEVSAVPVEVEVDMDAAEG